MKRWIEFETLTGERFWASGDSFQKLMDAARIEFPFDGLTIRTMEIDSEKRSV